MAAFSCIASKSFSPSLYPLHLNQSINASFPFTFRSTSVRFPGEFRQRRIRGVSVVTRAGPPSTNQFIFAFVFPLSLLAFTVFTAIQIGNRLDQKFLEELAMNEAINEAEDENDDGTEVVIPRKEEPALPRARNRPKREI
ncbi:unnamed protein product [Amaranthus hypochondriacus]